MFIDNQPEICKPSPMQTEAVNHGSKDHDSMVYMPPPTTDTSNLSKPQQYHEQNYIEQQQQQQRRQQQQHHVSFKLH